MTERRLGIIMHGVTGRMGTNQHLVRSILAIRDAGGVVLGNGDRVMPEPVLVGRSADKLAALAAAHGVARWTTDLGEVLGDAGLSVFFDAGSTQMRSELLHRAIDAGKHVYCEKPVAASLDDALSVWRRAQGAGVKHGVVQDKLWLPGIVKLNGLLDDGFFGRVLSVRGEFGYWVFEGDDRPAQRPSWNYRREDGGGIVLDMLPHWHYVLENLFGEIRAVNALAKTHIPERWDEAGARYAVTADDSVYATFQIAGDVVAHFNCSWAVRVRRDDLLTIQVDGTHGSAVAGLRECRKQAREDTPVPMWNPDVASEIDYFDDWSAVPDTAETENAFKAQWQAYIRHVCEDAPFPWDLEAGARGVQLAALGLRSSAERRWIDIPELDTN